MNDSLKMFLIALVVSVAVQALLAPYILEFHGFTRQSGQPGIAAPIGAPPEATGPVGTPAANDEGLTAPNLEGMLVDDARKRFRERGIVIIEDGLRAEPGVAPGTILQQRPTPGATLRNMEIRVIVARPGGKTQVPDVLGKEIEQARASLVESGFEVPPPKFEASEEPKGTVIRQLPNPGAQSKPGGKVQLVVAQQAAIEVPKVTGQFIRSARKQLSEAGLAVGSVRRREHPELGEDFVLAQSPEPGGEVPPGTEIDLVIVAPN